MKLKLLSLFLFSLFIISCKSESSRINECKEIVNKSVLNLEFDPTEMTKNYPDFYKINPISKVTNFKIINAAIDKNNLVKIFSTSDQGNILFILGNVDNSYRIKSTKGLSRFYGKSIYRVFEKMNCFNNESSDLEIAAVCKPNEARFVELLDRIKTKVEKAFVLRGKNFSNDFGILFLQTVVVYFGYYKLQGSDYELTYNFVNGAGEPIFAISEEKKPDVKFGTIINGNMTTSSFRGKTKLQVKVRLTNTKILEKQIVEKLKDYNNCSDFKNIDDFIYKNQL